MTRLTDLWTALAAPTGILDRRPRPDFDPAFYAQLHPELPGDAAALAEHFAVHGRPQGWHGTRYAQLRAQAPHIDAVLAGLVTHPDLRALIEAEVPGALELAFELIQLGAPVDARISDFSMAAYLEWHPDIQAAGLNPLTHYLRFGAVEGGRRILADLRRDLTPGGQAYRPERPTVLICLPELSDDGISAIGRDLVGGASRSHNVVVAALRGGPLQDRLLAQCCGVLITRNPLRELPYVEAQAFQRIDLGLLNSVEAALFVHPLVARDIPFAVYVHEHADDDTHAPWMLRCTAAFADLLVFCSDHVRDSWRGRLADLAFDVAADSTVIPPRPLIAGAVPPARRQAARDSLSRVLGRDLGRARLVCGVGQAHWRKGTDIFLQAAQIARDRDPETVFVWIGDGRNRQDRGFGLWFDTHLRQAGAWQPGIGPMGGNLVLLPAGPLYPDVMDAADALFLSSRLDPLPDAVFDAVGRGQHVVCFDGATGFGDDRYAGSDRIIRVPYANPAAAVEALCALPAATAAPHDPEPQGPPLFDRLRAALEDRLAGQRHFLLGETAIDIPFLFGKSEADRPRRAQERRKLFRYGRRLLWRDLQDARDTLAASDNWVHRRSRLEPYATLAPTDPAVPDFAIHIHAFYIDDLAHDLRGHAAFARARRIVVTTDTAAKAERIRAIGLDQGLPLQTLVVPNQGRDILPFLRLFAPDGAAGEDRIWCHLHQKKSVQTTGHGDVWRRFLHRILLGDGQGLSSAAALIGRAGTGLVAPFEPHFVAWDESRRWLPAIADRFDGPMPDNPLLFPVGNMFWTQADVARRMLALFGPDHPWPNEPIPTDGTEFHLIERLWPAMAAQAGLDSVFVHKMDEPRV